MSVDGVAEFEHADEVVRLRDAAATLSRQLVEAKQRSAALVKAVYDGAREASLIQGRPAVTPPPRDKRTANPEVALLHCSDWQLGKRTASYDSDVAEERVKRYTHKAVRITEIQRTDHPVKAAALCYGGDMGEGVNIFPGQAYEIDSTVYEQLFRVVNLIEWQVRTLAAVFEELDVFAEWGNHGRIGRRGDFAREDNFDLIAYRIAQERTVDLKNVTWSLSTNWYNMVTIGNYSALLVHGDEVKSFGGQTPAFGILRKVSAWATGVVPGGWTDCYMGHWHQPLTLPIPRGGRVFVSPSTESDNEYAREFVAAAGRPGQRLNFVNPEKGEVTAEFLVWLD